MSEEEVEFHDAIDEFKSEEEEESMKEAVIEPITPTKQLEAAFQNLTLTSPPRIIEKVEEGICEVLNNALNDDSQESNIEKTIKDPDIENKDPISDSEDNEEKDQLSEMSAVMFEEKIENKEEESEEGWLDEEIDAGPEDLRGTEEQHVQVAKRDRTHSSGSSMDISNSLRNSSELPSISQLSFEEMRSRGEREDSNNSAEAQEVQEADTAGGYYWGGMLSVFGGLKEKATTHLNKLCDSFDPNANLSSHEQVQAEEEDSKEGNKSIRSLFDRLSPNTASAEEGQSGWFQGLDRTFDAASDKIGQALIGGIKKLENTMGVTIEPVSSNSSLVASDGDLSQESGPVNDNGSPVGESSLGRNLYSAGLSTLERIGRTTANIVVNTKERLAPMIDQTAADLLSFKPSETQRIDRTELKKSFLELFDEFSGNIALEKIHLSSSEASIALKTKLKSLPPALLREQQAKLKLVGKQLLEEECLLLTDFDLENMDLFEEESREMISRMIQGINSSCELLNTMNEAVESLRERVDSPLPVDNPSLVLYFCRYHLAKVTAASLYIMVEYDYDSHDESDLVNICAHLKNKLDLFKGADLETFMEDKRREALESLICADAESGQKILNDALQLTIPKFKYACFRKG